MRTKCYDRQLIFSGWGSVYTLAPDQVNSTKEALSIFIDLNNLCVNMQNYKSE